MFRCTTDFRTYFSGDWDVYWGYGGLTHGHVGSWELAYLKRRLACRLPPGGWASDAGRPAQRWLLHEATSLASGPSGHTKHPPCSASVII